MHHVRLTLDLGDCTDAKFEKINRIFFPRAILKILWGKFQVASAFLSNLKNEFKVSNIFKLLNNFCGLSRLTTVENKSFTEPRSCTKTRNLILHRISYVLLIQNTFGNTFQHLGIYSAAEIEVDIETGKNSTSIARRANERIGV